METPRERRKREWRERAVNGEIPMPPPFVKMPQVRWRQVDWSHVASIVESHDGLSEAFRQDLLCGIHELQRLTRLDVRQKKRQQELRTPKPAKSYAGKVVGKRRRQRKAIDDMVAEGYGDDAIRAVFGK